MPEGSTRHAIRLGRRSLLVKGGLAGAAGIVAACAAPSAPAAPAAQPAPAAAPRRGGTVVNALQAEITNLDPGVSGDQPSLAAFSLVYEGLVGLTPDLATKPDLATSWESKDRTWTFKLRPGVKFHDGTPFNAAAVKANFDRYYGPDKPLRANQVTPIIEGVEIVDELTVRFTTKTVDYFFIDRMADAAGITGSWAFIISPAAITKYGKDLAKQAVGTGPFTFVEWIKDERFVVARNDAYWGDKAFLDRVILRAIPEPEARAIALESLDIQVARTLNPETAQRIEKNAALTTSVRTTTRSLFIGLANLKKPFSDIRVRQALNHAIDKQGIVKNIYSGLAEQINGGVVPGQTGYVALPEFAYDPAKAKQLLAAAGYPNGFSTTLLGPKGAYFKDFELQQAVQQQLRAIGVDVKLETVEFAKYLDELRKDPKVSGLEMWQDATGGGPTVHWLLQRYGCAYFRPNGTNTAGSCFSDVDALAMEAQSAPDGAKRLALLKEAQEKLSLQAPSIWALATREAAGVSKKVRGLVHMGNGVVTVDERTWLDG